MIDVAYCLTIYGIPSAVFFIWAAVLHVSASNPGAVLVDAGPAADKRLVYAIAAVVVIGLLLIAPMPWSSPRPALALACFAMAIASVLAFSAVMIRARIQVTKRGIVGPNGLVRWERIAFCGWSDNGQLVLRTRGSLGSSMVSIPLAAKRDQVDPILQEHLSEDIYPRVPEPMAPAE